MGGACELPLQRGSRRPPWRSCAVVAGLAVAIHRRLWRCGGVARVRWARDVRAGRQVAVGSSWAGCSVPFGATFGPRCSAVLTASDRLLALLPRKPAAVLSGT